MSKYCCISLSLRKYFTLKVNDFIKTLLLIIVVSTSVTTHAQQDKLGSWHIANFNYHINSKFALYGELQLRSQKLADDFYYHEIKTGIAYNFQTNSVFFGLGNYETYTTPGNFKKPLVANEFRMWEQFVLNNNINRVKIEHRFRIEQRWIKGEYSNRFRYRINPIVPLNHKTIGPKTVFITAFEEVFFTNKPPYFIRNRLFGGAGYQFNKLFTFQLGFIRQFDYRIIDDGSGKNFLQTSFMFNINNTSTKREVHPSSMD